MLSPVTIFPKKDLDSDYCSEKENVFCQLCIKSVTVHVLVVFRTGLIGNRVFVI